MTIRLAQYSDIPEILTVLEAAKGIMRQSGNPNQWAGCYPSDCDIRKDIDASVGYVIEEDRLVAYFAFIPSPEPTYFKIEGRWLDSDAPYHVIHRLGSLPEAHGIFASVMNFAFSKDRNIRIDTHHDNKIMQHNIIKHGFTYCGIIYLASGDPRQAYQRID